MNLLGGILHSLGVDYHFSADDSQIYVMFDILQSHSAVKPQEWYVCHVLATIFCHYEPGDCLRN